jgi:hypothetical protein
MIVGQGTRLFPATGPDIKREIVRVGRQPGGDDQHLELQMPEAEGGRLGRHRRSADVVSRRVRQDAVDHADLVEADHHRQPTRDRRGLVAAHVL